MKHKYKGYKIKRGYVRINVSKNDPLFDELCSPGNKKKKGRHGYIYEHRYIASLKIGRVLKKTEHVHHLNGIKDDNRPENLVVIDGGDHLIVTVLEQRVRGLEAEIVRLKKKYE